MADANFIPFVPRRAGSRTQPAVDDCVGAASSQVQAGADGAQTNGDTVQTELDPHAIGPAQQSEQTVCGAHEGEDPKSCLSETIESARCDHTIEIRNAAIRLAAIACGRALHHAVMLHPGIIAAFVDDALTASGYPQLARVRVHPDSIEQLAPSRYDCIGDEGLAPGDVVVECGDLSLGASLLERAALLVASAGA